MEGRLVGLRERPLWVTAATPARTRVHHDLGDGIPVTVAPMSRNAIIVVNSVRASSAHGRSVPTPLPLGRLSPAATARSTKVKSPGAKPNRLEKGIRGRAVVEQRSDDRILPAPSLSIEEASWTRALSATSAMARLLDALVSD
jgi:hypothetical protein